MTRSSGHRRTFTLSNPALHLSALSLISALTISSSALAQAPAATRTTATSQPAATAAPAAATKPAQSPLATSKTTASKPASAKAGQAPRDPEGIKGISPYWEAINRGDAEFAALNYEGAAKEYRSAITKDPKNALGHLRMCELSLKQRDLLQAREFVDSALRFAGADQHDRAQAAFLLAGIAELQEKSDDALLAWTNYKQLDPTTQSGAAPQNGASSQAAGDAQSPVTQSADAHPAESETSAPLPARIHVASADARTQAIEARKKMLVDYAPVLERIKKNVEAADEATGSAAGTGSPADSSTSEGSKPNTPAK